MALNSEKVIFDFEVDSFYKLVRIFDWRFLIMHGDGIRCYIGCAFLRRGQEDAEAQAEHRGL